MERHAHGALAHVELASRSRGSRRHRARSPAPRSAAGRAGFADAHRACRAAASARRCRPQACPATSSIGTVIAAPAPAHGVDQLVARDRPHPGAERHRRVPGMALEMNGQQGLLHNVLGFLDREPGTSEPAPRDRTDRRRQAGQQPVVGGRIARHGGTHQTGPIALALAHSALPLDFVPGRGTVTKLQNFDVDSQMWRNPHVPVRKRDTPRNTDRRRSE